MRMHTTRRTRMRLATLGLAVSMFVVLAGGPMSVPAIAHSKLVSSSPSDGATLNVPPVRVEFTFDEELLDGTTVISINDDQGNAIATTRVDPAGTTISAPWPEDAGAGTYQVAYRIVSADGHPVTGAITFEVAESGAATRSAVPRATASSSPEAVGEPTTRADREPLIIGVIVVVTIVGLASLVIITRRRRSG